MVIKSIATEGQDEKGHHVLAKMRRIDSRTASSRSQNQEPVTSITRRIEQPLIKILICDDDLVGRKLIQTYLQRMTGKEIVLLEAGYTKEIRNALDKGRIDLVLINNQVPGKSGMECLAEISKKQLAPVVMLTGSRPEEIATQPFQRVALACLPQGSLSLDSLSKTIDAALDKWTRLQQAKADKEKLERLATFDLLTGLYNRQTILSKLRELVNLSNRYKGDFSLVLLDIDHFRKVNACHGHLTGDEVLERIAALIRGNVRDTDIAGRYGGQAFIIILPNTNLASSWVAAERLRTIIEKTEFKDFAGNVFAVTVSQGVVGWERNDYTASLLSRADEALRKAKGNGRNRVQISLGPSLRDKV